MINLAQDLKPVSYVQAHTTEVLDYVENSKSPVVVTKDGEAKVVIIFAPLLTSGLPRYYIV